MDKFLYVAMSGAKQTLLSQTANNNNLANVSTTGFKADLDAFKSQPIAGAGYASRVYASDFTTGWDSSAGAQITTGRSLDLAVHGPGYIAVQDAEGGEAYTRAGDLHIDPNGQLLTATGHQVMGDQGPISVPPANSVDIAPDGTVSIVPLGQPASTIANIGRIKLTNPGNNAIERSTDGLYRTRDGKPAAADAKVTVTSGALESSNVNLAGAMMNMIELARRFELQVKALHSAEENAATSSKLLQPG